MRPSHIQLKLNTLERKVMNGRNVCDYVGEEGSIRREENRVFERKAL